MQCVIRARRIEQGLRTAMASIVKLPSGSWRAQVMHNGVRKGMTFKKYADAKRWAAEIESKLESIKAIGTAPTPKGVLMSDSSILHLRNFVDKRIKQKTQVGSTVSGVTIAVDLSYISTILHWVRDVKLYDINAGIENEVRSSLSRRGISTEAIGEKGRLRSRSSRMSSQPTS